MRGCANDACWTNLPHFRLAYLQQKKVGWSGWIGQPWYLNEWLWYPMILYDCISIKKGFSDFQSVFMTELESNHDSNPQSSISNTLGVQLPKREAKILRAALFQQVWQFQQIAPSSVFRAVLDGRRTCKSSRASTHESSDVMCLQYQYTSHTVLNCVGGTVAIA